MNRTGRIERSTAETKVLVEIDLDGTGSADISTGVGFFDHMLGSFAKHGLFDLTVHVDGDLHIDAHHSVEDAAIALGQAFAEAAGDKAGTRRFGDAVIPMDEVLVSAAVDLSGRPYLVHTEPDGAPAYLLGPRHPYATTLTRHVFESFTYARPGGAARHRARRPGLAPHHRGAVQGGGPGAAGGGRTRTRGSRACRPPRACCSGGPMRRVTVLDYGSGNVRSAVRALERVGAEVELSADPAVAVEADGLVVPGVGAFAACMAGLRQVEAQRILAERVRAGRPVLGICVGMQVLFAAGIEHGVETPGLGLLPGRVEPLAAPVIPHMGWNTVRPPAGSVLFAGMAEGTRFYFVHSYAVHPGRTEDANPDPGQPGRSARSPWPSTASSSSPRWRSGRCRRPSSTRRSPATPERSCWPTGWARCEEPGEAHPAVPAGATHARATRCRR